MVKDQVLEDIINAKNGYLGTGWTLESVTATYDDLLEARFYRMGEGIVLNDTYNVLDKECLKLTGKKLNEWIGSNKDRVRELEPISIEGILDANKEYKVYFE